MSAKSIYLMHEDTPVLKFNFATVEYKVLSKMFMPYKLKDRINNWKTHIRIIYVKGYRME